MESGALVETVTSCKRKSDQETSAIPSAHGTSQSSIYRGVSLHKGTMKFRATIKIKGAKIALGSYEDEVEAAKAFDRAALRYRGSRADVNFPQSCRPAKKQKQENSTSKPRAKVTVAPRTGLRSRTAKIEVKEEEEDTPARHSHDASDDCIQLPKQQPLQGTCSPFAACKAEREVKTEMKLAAEALEEIEGSEDLDESTPEQEDSDTADSKPQSDVGEDFEGAETSHGLNVLKSRFQLYRFESDAASASGPASHQPYSAYRERLSPRPCHWPSSRLERLDSSDMNSSGPACSVRPFRHRLATRCRLPNQGYSPSRAQMTERQSALHMAPVLFDEQDYLERRNSWWRMQLRLF